MRTGVLPTILFALTCILVATNAGDPQWLTDMTARMEEGERLILEAGAHWASLCAPSAIAALKAKKLEEEKTAFLECLKKIDKKDELRYFPDAFFEMLLVWIDDKFAALTTKPKPSKEEFWAPLGKLSEQLFKLVKKTIGNYPLGYHTAVVAKTAPVIVYCSKPASAAYAPNDLPKSVQAFLACAKQKTNPAMQVPGVPEKFLEEFAETIRAVMAKEKTNKWATFHQRPTIDPSISIDAFTTLNDVFSEFIPGQKTPGTAKHDQGGKALHKLINEEKLKGKQFENVFTGYKRVDPEPLGNGKNAYGVAYLVQKSDKAEDQVMKIVKNGFDQNEYKNHKALYDIDFKTTQKINDKFIPAVYGEKKTADGLDFYVMEYLGPTVGGLLAPDTKDPKKKKLKDFKLTDKEKLLALARMYLILRALHTANYAHLDAHHNNFAYSRNSQHILYLFDFGRTVKLAGYNYYLVLEDLWKWRGVAYVLCLDDSDPKNQKWICPGADKFLPSITEALNDNMWTKPVRTTTLKLHLPNGNFHAMNFKQFMASKLIVALDKLVDGWLKINGANKINETPAPLTTWTPKAEAAKSRRRRSVEEMFKKDTVESVRVKANDAKATDQIYKEAEAAALSDSLAGEEAQPEPEEMAALFKQPAPKSRAELLASLTIKK